MQTENTENLDLENNIEQSMESENELTSQVESDKVIEEIEADELTVEEKLKLELGEMKDKYIRMYSEFENFRRRTSKEKVELIQNASQNVLRELIPVVDDFERAQASFQTATDIQPIKEGISLVFDKLNNTMTRQGLKPMDAQGKVFDVELHECITQIDAEESMIGKVVDVIEKGYTLNDKVIRYAKVVVGK
ncbi:MAG: molecular chaperone GrpE [Spirosomataceae bacterium]|jgi:molecular chaperone GrpE